MKPPRVTLIDYGMGNLRSVAKAFEHLGATVSLACSAKEIPAQGPVVVPGVGAFGQAMENLHKRRLVDVLKDIALKSIQSESAGQPFLGICLGLQVLFHEAEEFGTHSGLGVFPGRVLPLKPKPDLKIPHMGWNGLDLTPSAKSHPLWQSFKAKPYFYFVHSNHVVPKDSDIVHSRATHGQPLVAAIQKGRLFATQFHPEKSQSLGLKLLKNFLEWSA